MIDRIAEQPITIEESSEIKPNKIEKIIQDNEWATLYKITEPTMEFKP